MRVQVQFGFGAQFLFQRSDELVCIVRKQQIRHVFDTNIIRAHVLVSFGELHEIIERMNGAGRIGNCRLANAFSACAVFFDRLHGRFDVARIVECVEHAHDADAVLDRFFHDFFDEIVGIIAVTEQILSA